MGLLNVFQRLRDVDSDIAEFARFNAQRMSDDSAVAKAYQLQRVRDKGGYVKVYRGRHGEQFVDWHDRDERGKKK